MDEFALIEQVFARLAPAGAPAFGLGDDAAVLSPEPGCDLVLTKDMITAGRHFFPDDAPDLIARKLMRVNLSDLAAMGATPVGCLLGLGFGGDLDADLARRMALGLAADQAEFGCPLIGGDTISGVGGLTLSLTAIGQTPHGQALRRNGAAAGDLICVSGTIGDAALALRLLEAGQTVSDDDRPLIDRYYLPQPRLALGQALRGLASACIDVSDGLVADLGHICVRSGLDARLRLNDVPLSDAARRHLADKPELIRLCVSGGDDYELAFTLAPARLQDIHEAAHVDDLPIAVIGEMVEGAGQVSLLDGAGAVMDFGPGGFRH